MQPIFSVSSRYQRQIDNSDTELQDLCHALQCIRQWSEGLGVECRMAFSDPGQQAEYLHDWQEFLRENGLVAKVRRLFNKNKQRAKVGPLELVRSAKSITIDASAFDNIDGFAAAALEALDRNAREIHVSADQKARNALSVYLWRGELQSYWATLSLYRFDDRKLTLIVSLLSMKAWEDSEIRPVGTMLLSGLESEAPFIRWAG